MMGTGVSLLRNSIMPILHPTKYSGVLSNADNIGIAIWIPSWKKVLGPSKKISCCWAVWWGIMGRRDGLRSSKISMEELKMPLKIDTHSSSIRRSKMWIKIVKKLRFQKLTLSKSIYREPMLSSLWIFRMNVRVWKIIPKARWRTWKKWGRFRAVWKPLRGKFGLLWEEELQPNKRRCLKLPKTGPSWTTATLSSPKSRRNTVLPSPQKLLKAPKRKKPKYSQIKMILLSRRKLQLEGATDKPIEDSKDGNQFQIISNKFFSHNLTRSRSRRNAITLIPISLIRRTTST